jgi:carbamoyl-phosphate synthase large subunit
LPSAGKSTLFERLRYIQAQEHIDVLIPNFDAELFNFIGLAKALKNDLGIHTFMPSMEQFEARHKSNLAEFGRTHGISIPKSKMIFQLSDIAALKNEFKYPLVVKGKFYDASVAYSPDQAATYFNKIAAKWGLPIIVQEFVTGEELNVTALGDGEGTMIGAVAMRKQYITDKGKAWSGISIDDKKLMQMSADLFQSTKWRGGLELEIIKDAAGTYYLIEINPRFPAWVYLAVGCGQNHPEALVKMALGENVAPFTQYDVGKMFVRYSYDLIVTLNEFEKIATTGEL